MTTIRSPKGLTLTVLATLTVVVLVTGWLVESADSTLAEQATLVRVPALAGVSMVFGGIIWTVLALISYWIRIGPLVVAAVLLLGGWVSYRSYAESWEFNRFESPTLLSTVPATGSTGVWRGITGGQCNWLGLTRLTIREDDSVLEEYWSLYYTVLFPALHALRAVPDTPPSIRTGRLIGDVIYWTPQEGYSYIIIVGCIFGTRLTTSYISKRAFIGVL